MKEFNEHCEEWEEINQRFSFLPEYGINAAVLAFPFARSAGIGEARFEEIIDGSEPDIEEIEILKWTCDIGFKVIDALTTKDITDRFEKANEAMGSAAKYIDRKTAEEAMHLTVKAMRDFFNEGEKAEKGKK